MIKLEKMLGDSNPNADIAADIILSLMKRAYIAGREDGYEQGFNDCKNPLADAELDAAYRDGEQAGYIAGREDGYDEGVMDLVEVDGYDEAFDNALRTINEVYEEETWNR